MTTIAPEDFESHVWDRHTAVSPHHHLDPNGDAHVQWTLNGVPAWACQANRCDHITLAASEPKSCAACGTEGLMGAVYQMRLCDDLSHEPDEVAW